MAVAGWVDNTGVRLEYLESPTADEGLTPVLFVPGLLGSAEFYRSEIVTFAPRRVVALSLRGRGASDAPARGYGFDDQVSDLIAVLIQTQQRRCCLVAFSHSVPFAITAAARHPDRLAGLVLNDYPAQHRALTPAWVEGVRPFAGTVPADAVTALQRESTDASAWELLGNISCPVLVLRGGQPGARLTAADADRYRQALPQSEVMTFDDAGHELWRPDVERYLNVLRAFFAKLDRG